MKHSLPAFLFAMTIIFTAAKILGHFNYSWLWVFSPLWIPIAVITGLSVVAWVFLTFVGILILLTEGQEKKCR
jgi:hypothetical protein